MRPALPAYIVLGHKRPDLFARLVDALDHAPVGAHIDRKVDIAPFEAALQDQPNVTFLPRHVCQRGNYGHVAGSREGLKWFLGTDSTDWSTRTRPPSPSRDARPLPIPLAPWLQSLVRREGRRIR